jgi:Putative DNA-binding domain
MVDETPWEDCLLERKVENDLKDLLKTLVAFSNSVRPGHTATILIGEKDDGTVQGVQNPDNIQKGVREECDKIYPPILWRSQVYENNGKYCVRVEIEYDGETPHFGGSAWIRRGSESIRANNEIFQKLIEFRTSKIRYLAGWLGKPITFVDVFVEVTGYPATGPTAMKANLFYVGEFYVTVQLDSGLLSVPLEELKLSWDDERAQPKLIVKD